MAAVEVSDRAKWRADIVDVSVVIPCYLGHCDKLEAAVSSAERAGAASIIVAADGFYVHDFVENAHDRVISINCITSKIPQGVVSMRNVAISETAQSLILPLDADDTLLPGAIDALTAAYEPGTFVYGNWLENGVEVKSAPQEMLRRKSIAGCTFLFAKSDWERVGGYDKDFEIGGEDYAFMFALVEAGVRPVRIDVPIYNRTLSDTGRSAKTKARWPMVQALLREKYPDFFPVAREILERI